MDEDISPLTGCVEVDETYIGGEHSGKTGCGASGKTIVMAWSKETVVQSLISFPMLRLVLFCL